MNTLAPVGIPAVDESADPLSHLTPASRRDFHAFGFGPHVPLRQVSLVEAFAEQVARSASATAVEDHDGRSLTYAELDRASSALAASLQERGVVPGDRVGVFLTRSLELVVSILAVLKAGAAWVPQDVRITPEPTLRDIVRIADIRVTLTHRGGLGQLAWMDDEPIVVDAEALAGQDESHRPTPVTADAVAVVIFTSGTTGVPNGVQVTHDNLLNTLTTGPAGLGIQPGMRVAQLLNIAFDMAVWEIAGALLHGGTLLIRGSDLQETAARADVVIATPSVLAQLDPTRCRRVRIVAVAGERCPEDLAERWRHRARFHNSCGPTEVTIVNTVHELSAGDRLTIGEPLPNTTVYVLDEQLRPVETGEVGEMWAGGACVTAGYLGNPELTAERYRPDPFTDGVMFRCRDLVSWTADGRLLHHGRTDDQVKVRGFRVELDAVTTAMERPDEVAAACTIVLDGRLVGVLVPSGPAPTHPHLAASEHATVAAATESLAEALPYFYTPDQFCLVDHLPMTTRGKVDRRALSATVSDLLRKAAA